MARDLLDLSASVGATAAALRVAQKVGVQKAALHMTTSIRTEITMATGDGRLSGVGRRGAKVGAGFDVKGSVDPTALIKPKGPLWLVENDTGAHRIPRSRSRRARRRYVVIDGHPYASARHPGTRGKHPFRKGVGKTRDDTPRIFQHEVRKAVVDAWGL
jgi:hypothetical protein